MHHVHHERNFSMNILINAENKSLDLFFLFVFSPYFFVSQLYCRIFGGGSL